MSNESNRADGKPNPQSSEQKASDFFPPGEGWNQSEKPKAPHRDDDPSCGPTVDPKPN